MRYCTNCGNAIPNEASFCGVCGTPAAVLQNQYDYDEEKAFLDYTHRFLRYERLAWKISGIVLLILSLIYVGFGLLFFVTNLILDTSNGSTIFSGLFYMEAILFLVYGIVFLPIAIINIKMVKKVEGYMSGMYTDVRPTATRNASVGMIVFGAIFNTIAMVFYIINFANTKSKGAVIDRIIRRQQGTL